MFHEKEAIRRIVPIIFTGLRDVFVRFETVADFIGGDLSDLPSSFLGIESISNISRELFAVTKDRRATGSPSFSLRECLMLLYGAHDFTIRGISL